MTTIRRDAFVVLQPDLHTKFGSGTGIRTLNLAVNRSLPPVQMWHAEFANCRRVSPHVTVWQRRCCTEDRLHSRFHLQNPHAAGNANGNRRSKPSSPNRKYGEIIGPHLTGHTQLRWTRATLAYRRGP